MARGNRSRRSNRRLTGGMLGIMKKTGISRRGFIVGAASAGVATPVGLPKIAMAQDAPNQLAVPELPMKVFSTERAGISRKTHEEHLKLWQVYAKKTNEIRQALATVDTDPAKANQIYSQIRSLKVEYSFAYEGYIN